MPNYTKLSFMDREIIIERLTPVVREVFADENLVVIDSMSSETVPTWTSLSFMQLLSRIEAEFNFKFKIFELINIHCMGDLIDSIAAHCA